MVSRGYAAVVVHGLLVAAASPAAEHGLQGWGLSSGGSQALGHKRRVSSCGSAGLAAPGHVGSFRTRD